MKDDYTHITVILDRTGSMESIRDDTIGGFNTFLKDQQTQPGHATLTLVQFDSQDPYEVIHSFKPVGEVPALTRETFVPRASTPLLDAIGRGILDLESNLARLGEGERPAKVMVVILTDGRENASREFRKERIKSMIREKQEESGWQFMFLAADQEAIDEAQALGFPAAATMVFAKTSRGTMDAFTSMSRQTSKFRSGNSGNLSFDDDDRARQQSLDLGSKGS